MIAAGAQALRELRTTLPPYTPGAAAPVTLQGYCHRYGIDFPDLPDCRHSAGVVDSGEYQLVVQQWHPAGARATLLLVHGFTDHTGLFGHLIAWGLAQGLNVLIFDLPGHGLSSGEPLVIDDFADYGRAIADVLAAARVDGPLWVMAQSTGGAALVEYARHFVAPKGWPFCATVLLAPLVRPAGWRAIRPASRLLQPFLASVPRKLARNTSDGAFMAVLQSDPLQVTRTPLRWVIALGKWLAHLEHRDLGVGPALVIQGDRDSTVDWRYNLGVIAQLFPGSRIEYLSGAGHQLANEAQAVRARYLATVADYVDAAMASRVVTA